MTRLERLEKASLTAAIVCGLFGLASSGGCRVVPEADPGWAWLGHAVLLLLGAGAGVATILRGVEIDRRRWEILADPLLTKGERDYAHKEAERQRRLAGTFFLLAPLFLGYWMSYQVHGGEGGRLVANLLGVTPLLSFFVGLLVGKRFEPRADGAVPDSSPTEPPAQKTG